MRRRVGEGAFDEHRVDQFTPSLASRGRVGEEAVTKLRNPITQLRASALRKRLTDAEQPLWQHLRRRQLHGARFRRQVPIGRFIADFASHDARLIIELDGGQHGTQRGYDELRDAELVSLGYQVLRFWDNDVLQQTDSVLERIRLVPAESPPS